MLGDIHGYTRTTPDGEITATAEFELLRGA
jgi:hypothetical protein